MGRKKMRSQAQARRAELLKAHGLRGGAKANLWMTEDPRTGRDLFLIGDARHEHFYATEGDPDVVDAAYNLDEIHVPIAGRQHSVRFDARVELADGRIEFRKVVSTRTEKAQGQEAKEEHLAAVEAAQRLGGTYRLVTLRELDELKQRVSNWRRVLRTLRACSNTPFSTQEAAVRRYMDTHRACTIGDLLDHFSDTSPSMITQAAIASLLHKRILFSDLDVAMWSRHTRISRGKLK